MDPIGSLIGSVLLGFGTILLYGAYKNRRVFGQDGIIPQAISTGSITSTENVPEAFSGFGIGAELGAGGGKGASTGSKGTGSGTKVGNAISNIKSADPTLGSDIENRVNAISSGSSLAELMPLAQLLAIADAKGFRDSVGTIRSYVLGVTGERI